jgi:hypothetical protein
MGTKAEVVFMAATVRMEVVEVTVPTAMALDASRETAGAAAWASAANPASIVPESVDPVVSPRRAK